MLRPRPRHSAAAASGERGSPCARRPSLAAPPPAARAGPSPRRLRALGGCESQTGGPGAGGPDSVSAETGRQDQLGETLAPHTHCRPCTPRARLLFLPHSYTHAHTHPRTPACSHTQHAHGSPQPRPGSRLGSVLDEACGLLSPALAVPGVPCGTPRGDNDPAGAHTCTFCRATFSLLLPP